MVDLIMSAECELWLNEGQAQLEAVKIRASFIKYYSWTITRYYEY